jgi:hypothetical protein
MIFLLGRRHAHLSLQYMQQQSLLPKIIKATTIFNARQCHY